MKKSILILLSSVLLFSCEEPSNQSSSIDKKGSVEMSVSTKLLPDGRTVMIIHRNVWSNGVNTYSKIQYDTLTSLGTKMETYFDEEKGTEKNVSVPKEYEIYITFE
jgi:hypothetical protein